jgi:hypothetical protein
MQNKEIEKLLSCDNCLFYACEGCETTWTDRKKIREYIDQLENKVKELKKENDKLTYARNWYFEHTVNKIVTPEMLHKILRTKYIGREKIENKIAELDKEEKEIYKKDIGNNELYRLKIIDEIRSVLQELLEEK